MKTWNKTSALQVGKDRSESRKRQAVTRRLSTLAGSVKQKFGRRRASVCTLFLAVPLSLCAQEDKIWQGPAGTSSWFVPGNWTQNLLPTLTQRVVVDNGTTVQVG